MTPSAAAGRVLAAVLANPVNAALLSSLNDDLLPNWYLTAGCVCQSVWNALTGRDPRYGIHDYDVFYFDDSDLSYGAEDRAIRRTVAALGPAARADIEIRNQARVHLWYEERFGAPCARLRSAEDGIDQFLTRSMAIGIRRGGDGALALYAPDGLDDVLSLTVRPNVLPGRAARYAAKAASWSQRWPELNVLPWPVDERCRAT